MPRKDRRPRQRLGEPARRDAIFGAAAAAFAAAPYAQVSVARIAAAANASEALVHRYFGSKCDLYLGVVRHAISALLDRQRAADENLGPRASARDRIAASIGVYLDFVSETSTGWAAPLRSPAAEPPEAEPLRQRSRLAYVRLLRTVLELPPDSTLDYALHGYLGFIDAACVAWVDAGCPAADRDRLTNQALGALLGSLDRSARS